MRPLAERDGHDAPGLVDELVPCLTAMIDEIVVGFEDTDDINVRRDKLNRSPFIAFASSLAMSCQVSFRLNPISLSPWILLEPRKGSQSIAAEDFVLPQHACILSTI